MLVQLIATVATITTAAFLVPQIVRLIRCRERAGVSITWAALGLVTNLAWIAYLGPLGLWTAAAAPGLAVITYALLLRLLAPGSRSGWAVVAGTYSAALISIGWFGGPGAAGLALAVTPGIHLAPQIVTVFRERRPVGVSPWSWGIGTGEAALWAVYGFMVGDTALIGYGLVTSTGSTLVLAGWLARRGQLPSLPTSNHRADARDALRIAQPSLTMMVETHPESPLGIPGSTADEPAS